jgi:hypothetical protein
MVRAELGNGHRDRAVGLLERLQARLVFDLLVRFIANVILRNFPVAVYNRISGIMLSDSVSPWLSESASFDSQ